MPSTHTHLADRCATALLGNSTLSLAHRPWVTLNLPWVTEGTAGARPPSATHYVPHLPPSPDLRVLQLLELQVLSRAPQDPRPPGKWPLPGVPIPPLPHPPVGALAKAGPCRLFISLFAHLAHHVCTDGNDQWTC